MAIHHASSGELINVQPFGDKIATSLTQALFRTDRLEVIRMIILSGHEVPPHKMPGEVTIQCIEGKVDLLINNNPVTLRPGNLVCLSNGETYAMKADEDSSLLISMLLHVE